MTKTANLDRIHLSQPLAMPRERPALPDCRTVLEWDAGGHPTLRWETLEERDARLHEVWYRERAEQRWGYAHKKGPR